MTIIGKGGIKEIEFYMERGLTRLEVILIGIILFGIIVFSIVKNPSLFTSNENLLRQRYTEFASLMGDKNYATVYNYYSSSIRSNESLGKFIERSGKEAQGIGKQEVTINKVIIKDNIGYIDKNNIICNDSNCNTKKILRGYKKWVFENGNWYYSNENPTCIREKPYIKPPEFDRALSLIQQRYTEKFGAKSISLLNCLDIQYSSLENEEGLFTFNKNNSNMENLKIYVDNSYKIKDDILTAFLLSHEVQHASEYIAELNTGEGKDCFEDEIQAFIAQRYFLGSLNQSEQESILARINAANYANNPLIMIQTFLDYANNAMRLCGSNQTCIVDNIDKQISSMVRNSPYYQKQCSL